MFYFAKHYFPLKFNIFNFSLKSIKILVIQKTFTLKPKVFKCGPLCGGIFFDNLLWSISVVLLHCCDEFR